MRSFFQIFRICNFFLNYNIHNHQIIKVILLYNDDLHSFCLYDVKHDGLLQKWSKGV